MCFSHRSPSGYVNGRVRFSSPPTITESLKDHAVRSISGVETHQAKPGRRILRMAHAAPVQTDPTKRCCCAGKTCATCSARIDGKDFKKVFPNDLRAAQIANAGAKIESHAEGFVFRASQPPVRRSGPGEITPPPRCRSRFPPLRYLSVRPCIDSPSAPSAAVHSRILLGMRQTVDDTHGKLTARPIKRGAIHRAM